MKKSVKRILSLILSIVLTAALLDLPAGAATAPWVQIEGKGTDSQTVSLQGLGGRYTGVQITLNLDRAASGVSFTGSVANDGQSYTTSRQEGNSLTLYVTSKAILNQDGSLVLGALTAQESFTVVSASGLKLLNVGPGDKKPTVYEQVSMDGGSGSDPGSNPGSGSSSGTDRYPVAAASGITGGSLQISTTHAKRGQTVTVTATAESGYTLSAVTVTDKSGQAVAVTSKEDGTWSFVMPGSAVTVNAVFVPKQPEQLPFTDVGEKDWFREAVDYVYRAGLMSGTGDTTFSPETVTTRGMVVTILHRYEGTPAAAPSNFPDVPLEQYYTEAVAWAAANGVVNGYDNGSFMPDQAITREQMAAILYRYAQYKGMDVSGRADLSAFADADQVSGYAVDAMAWANHAGLINGMGDHTLQPKGSATRAQVAAILMRFCKLAG